MDEATFRSIIDKLNIDLKLFEESIRESGITWVVFAGWKCL